MCGWGLGTGELPFTLAHYKACTFFPLLALQKAGLLKVYCTHCVGREVEMNGQSLWMAHWSAGATSIIYDQTDMPHDLAWSEERSTDSLNASRKEGEY